jgi:hypothetical protein
MNKYAHTLSKCRISSKTRPADSTGNNTLPSARNTFMIMSEKWINTWVIIKTQNCHRDHKKMLTDMFVTRTLPLPQKEKVYTNTVPLDSKGEKIATNKFLISLPARGLVVERIKCICNKDCRSHKCLQNCSVQMSAHEGNQSSWSDE